MRAGVCAHGCVYALCCVVLYCVGLVAPPLVTELRVPRREEGCWPRGVRLNLCVHHACRSVCVQECMFCVGCPTPGSIPGADIAMHGVRLPHARAHAVHAGTHGVQHGNRPLRRAQALRRPPARTRTLHAEGLLRTFFPADHTHTRTHTHTGFCTGNRHPQAEQALPPSLVSGAMEG